MIEKITLQNYFKKNYCHIAVRNEHWSFMTFKIDLIFIALAILISGGCATLKNSKSDHQEMIHIIEPKVKEFIREIPEEYLVNFGIGNYAEVEASGLGTPVRVYMLENDSLVFTNTWRVAIISEDQPKALLTLIKDKAGNYEVVDFGAKILAQELADVNQMINFKGLLQVHELQRDFLFFEEKDGRIELRPIPDEGKHVFTLDEIIQMKR